jgi:outer membrane protein, multidrug efflux system
VSRALLSNTDVGSAQAALQQAQALSDVAAAALLPTLGASASAQHGSSGGDSTGSRIQLGVDGQWVPDVFGARRNALEASRAVAAASTASLSDAQVQVAAEVALNFILLRSLQARWLIAKNNLTSQQETLQITDWRQQAGLITVLELEQARAAAAQTQALLPALQSNIGQSGHALAVLVGQPPAALQAELEKAFKAVPSEGAVPAARGEVTLTIPAETLRQRADVRAVKYQFGAALAGVGKAQAQVIAMSRFAYLRTPMPADASATAQADAHVCLMDALGISQAAVMGGSAGGPSALQMAIRYPDRVSALVLQVPLAYKPGRALARTARLRDFRLLTFLSHVVSL